MSKRNYTSNLSLDAKVLMGIVRLAETFKRIHSTVFRNYGLSFPQYNVLRVLEASNKGENTIGNVSGIMLVPGANITGIAKRLVKEAFIIKKSDPHDERVTILKITAKGKNTLKKIEEEKDEWLAIMLNDLSRTEKNDFLDKVRRIQRSCMNKVNTV